MMQDYVDVELNVEGKRKYFSIQIRTREYPIEFGYNASKKYIREILNYRYGFTPGFIHYVLGQIDKLKNMREHGTR